MESRILISPRDVSGCPTTKFSNGWTGKGSTRLLRKYLTLLTKDYQFVDSDVVFLRNPVSALEPFEGFVVYCTEWNKPGRTYRPGTRKIMSAQASAWQSKVFNSGQHASSEALFSSWDELKRFIERPGIGSLLHP